MQFIDIAYEGTDKKLLNEERQYGKNHLNQAKKMFQSGKWLYAVGILNDAGVAIGSMVVCDFSSREELENHWLKKEPYIIGNVWEKIEIRRAQTAPFIGIN